MSLRTPLARARGLGSAKDGTPHWWMQRVTAVLLAPLSIWFLLCVLPMLAADYADARVWLAQPLNALLILAFALAVIYHALLGVQVVIEDYIHTRWIEVALLTSIRLIAFLAALATSLAIVRIAVGG
ncbi:MAG TPA: succinate dehydrogenase, hydrophobic membrane anchor protein [Pseudomonadota bacterium]|jgi:succinate dehydrogenase / fumarate reductase membrane anchor subunit|nr:succinate dehydrogenase, hydrophobic membrane anchor protein [Rhodanobacteraceae bacterium]MBP9155358.1 succinate dehydrogenase, hydrophobic membrane anchor protein [Xanthomonadales bacterium]HQW80581.1 succinate dehydrogenase, hydrophobic membrane anchor protein [Pseudomonadota bacterium]